MKRTGSVIFFLLIHSLIFSQGLIDTLKKKLNKAVNDSARLELYYSYSLNNKLLSKTTDSLILLLQPFTRSKDCRTKWFAELRLAMYDDVKDYDSKALAKYFDVLNIAEKCGDKLGMAMVTNRIGAINNELLNYRMAIDFLRMSVRYAQECGDDDDLAENYSLIGSAFRERKDKNLDSALFFTMKALELREKQGNKRKTAHILNNVGLIYKMKEDFVKAVEYLQKALEIRREVKDMKGVAGACINIANCLRDLRKFKEGLSYSMEGTKIAHDIKEGEFFRNGLSSLAELYYKMEDYKKASMYYRRQRGVSDSIKVDAIDKNMQELIERFESNKKDQAIKDKENAIRLTEAESSRKSVLIIFSSIALLMTMVAIGFVYRSYRINKKSAQNLAAQNKVIENKNKEITDSINYAKNIQQSLLTSEKIFAENCRDHFILFKPKDIVSGDFYWAGKLKDGFIVMCADCTGHGVPGAFMSLLGITHLKEITSNSGITSPEKVLNRLRLELEESFGKNERKDGIDASLIKINGNKLQMSAANNPVWIFREGKVIALPPDKFPIGKHHGELKDFTLQETELHQNDLLVLFTDGYADQFGGPNNKKYKYGKMERFLAERQHLSLNDLGTAMRDEIESWKGKNEQVDDILVIGIRI